MLLTQEFCYTCQKNTDHHDGKCAICLGRANAEAEAKWRAMPHEDRIEALRTRIELLERMVWPI